MPNKKVFVSGCYDLLHSGHVEFFKQAAEYGDLYVGIGSDSTILEYKNHRPIYPEKERLFMVKAIRYVHDAVINDGSGVMDFINSVDRIKPDIFVVNTDGGSEEKRKFCKKRGIEYIELERVPSKGLDARCSTDLKADTCQIPTRIDLAGTWIDQPYVSCHHPGWAITLSIEPTFEIRNRCGLSTSTRNLIKKIWPYKLPDMDPETLARIAFCYENNPERDDGIISGAQDAIGICMPGVVRHYYDNTFWPSKVESCYDEKILHWLESHICLIPLEPRQPNCSVVEGKDITKEKVINLTEATDRAWKAIMDMDLEEFGKAYRDSFSAQISMFPAMVQNGVAEAIEKYSNTPGVLAWKLTGAGGGGYMPLLCEDKFPEEAIPIVARRKGQAN